MAYKGDVTYGDNALTSHVWELTVDEQGSVGNFTYYVAADYCVPIIATSVVQDFRFSPRSKLCCVLFNDCNSGSQFKLRGSPYAWSSDSGKCRIRLDQLFINLPDMLS